MAELAQGNLNDVPQLIPYNPIMSMPHYCSLTPEEFESIRNNFGYIKYMLVFVIQVEMIKLQHVVNWLTSSKRRLYPRKFSTIFTTSCRVEWC